jgi:hypothetical protein
MLRMWTVYAKCRAAWLQARERENEMKAGSKSQGVSPFTARIWLRYTDWSIPDKCPSGVILTDKSDKWTHYLMMLYHVSTLRMAALSTVTSTTMHCSSCVILFLHESRLSLTRTSEPHHMDWRFQQKFCAIFVCHKHSARPKLARVWRFHLHEAQFVLVSFRNPNWSAALTEIICWNFQGFKPWSICHTWHTLKLRWCFIDLLQMAATVNKPQTCMLPKAHVDFAALFYRTKKLES